MAKRTDKTDLEAVQEGNHEVKGEVFGQEADALPLPSRIRRLVQPLVSEAKLRRWQSTRGSFLFVRASKPI